MLRRIAIGLMLALLSSGCAMKAYEGPKLPRSEIAVLLHAAKHGGVLGLATHPIPFFPSLNYRHQTIIIEIDGKNRGLNREVHILPGGHTARVHYRRNPDVTLCLDPDVCISNYETRDLSIDFTAEAGHDYRIPAERRDERNWIWVEDITTGKVVAGEKPPATPPK